MKRGEGGYLDFFGGGWEWVCVLGRGGGGGVSPGGPGLDTAARRDIRVSDSDPSQ